MLCRQKAVSRHRRAPHFRPRTVRHGALLLGWRVCGAAVAGTAKGSSVAGVSVAAGRGRGCGLQSSGAAEVDTQHGATVPRVHMSMRGAHLLHEALASLPDGPASSNNDARVRASFHNAAQAHSPCAASHAPRGVQHWWRAQRSCQRRVRASAHTLRRTTRTGTSSSPSSSSSSPSSPSSASPSSGSSPSCGVGGWWSGAGDGTPQARTGACVPPGGAQGAGRHFVPPPSCVNCSPRPRQPPPPPRRHDLVAQGGRQARTIQTGAR